MNAVFVWTLGDVVLIVFLLLLAGAFVQKWFAEIIRRKK